MHLIVYLQVMGEIREESISWEQRGETGCVADQLYLTERVFCQKVSDVGIQIYFIPIQFGFRFLL